MRVVGVLSGTSVDAIDVAAAEVTIDGDRATMLLLGHVERPWPAGLAERILAVLPPSPTTVAELCALDNAIGQAFGAAVAAMIAGLPGGRADLVASLGQTVFHDVSGGRCRGSLQLGQPAWIAEATGLPVVSDLRAADVAAGGHGAPLASTLDALWLAGPGGPRVALNLGGIANATVVFGPGEPVIAFDTGPGNCLLDLAAERLTGRRVDSGGALAAAGTVRHDLLERLRSHRYFALPPPKSTGRELFDSGYLDRALAGQGIDAPDLLATLTELTASTVAEALASYHPAEVIVSGGGARNPTLLAALRRLQPGTTWSTSDARGLPAAAKEAYLVALLGFLTWHNLPGTVPGPNGRTATGATHPTVLGRLTPGMSPAPVRVSSVSVREFHAS
ncbi:MAG TPA: anhydro-N-acetylmuramic acid kinase [Pseudonocardiaceae bacterium]|nr:anhydro-N-acetylmuramic acid kinase [Pseudonocardiaceae bacterium]